MEEEKDEEKEKDGLSMMREPLWRGGSKTGLRKEEDEKKELSR